LHRNIPAVALCCPGVLAALVVTLVVTLVATFVAPLASAADWPQFRGSERSGVTAASLAPTWPETGPPLLWKKAFGEGFSAISVTGQRLFTLAAFGAEEVALALDAGTGAELWRVPLGKKFVEEFGDGPRSTPTVDGERVYVVGSYGHLLALRVGNGEVIWEADLTERFGMPIPQRGFSPSPLIDGDLLILEIGAGEGQSIVALDKVTGETRWTVGDGPTGYSSPLAVTLAGVPQIVFLRRAEPQILGVSREGQVLWSHPFPASAIAMPVHVPPNSLFFSAAHDEVGMLLTVSRGEDGTFQAAESWRHNRMRNHFSASVVLAGTLYGFDNATLRAVDAATGEIGWAFRGFGKGSLIAAVGDDGSGGLLYVLSDRGELILVEATPEEYRERGRVQALTGKSWTAPSLADGRLFVRDHDEIACFDVSQVGR